MVVVRYCDMTHGRGNFPSQETIQDYCIRGGGGGGGLVKCKCTQVPLFHYFP